ncbi:MAG TPA: urea ABC transporter permease subunit UrtC [Acidimicrobiales bacterium]
MTALETAPGDAVAAPTKDRRRSPMSYLAPGTASPWVGRGVFVLVAIGLFLLPMMISEPTRIRQFAEYLCYAIVAVGIDIAWGYGGMLVLGQGLFFGMGAYAMGMYLTLENTPGDALPSFMGLYSDYTELPGLWQPFNSLGFAWIAAVIAPMALATALGLLVFKRRIRGPYFAILTQAMALVFWLLLVGQLQLTAGTNGLTNFSKTFGRNKFAPETPEFLYRMALVGLLVVIALGWILMRSRYGKLLTAVRDGEDRVRFLGYDPALVKTMGFAIAAGMAGLAGALSAAIIGIVAPNQFTILPSILMVCWVAVGGRGAIWGAVLGAIVVSWTKTNVSEARPDDWTYVQGALFIVVVGFIPGGIVGLVRSGRAFLTGRGSTKDKLDALTHGVDPEVPA